MHDEASGSVTGLLHRLRHGDEAAAQRLWETYFRQLVGLARTKLEGRDRLVGDEEDVALSAFKSFCRGVERGRFPELADRGDLWNILVAITLYKVLHLIRDEGRAKRGGQRKRVTTSAEDCDGDLLLQIVAAEPTPEMAAQVAEEAKRLLSQLPNQELVELALLKMEGYTNLEIAKRWQKSERTVERKLNLIRQLWSQNDSL
jgi:DNA-directed RNA polymerase specialized sigma24 family protein